MLALLLVALPVIFAATNPLGPYSVSDVTVSGLSSGGFMAVQLHVTYSSIINGSAIFAGVNSLDFFQKYF
jgi:poly(3-hydroxybutyrate) depolymerase